jgi:hypothetical protein
MEGMDANMKIGMPVGVNAEIWGIFCCSKNNLLPIEVGVVS